MVITNADEVQATLEPNYDRASELKAFDDTKAGVKGLVDAGIDKIPTIFYQPADNFAKSPQVSNIQYSFPVIDLEGVDKDPVQRKVIVERVRNASETWGFFQVISHGVPVSVLGELKNGVHRFYEEDVEVKKKFYSRDYTRKVAYNSNFDLYTAPAANWGDTIACMMAPDPPKAEELPAAFRDILMEYSNQVMKMAHLLFELLSEALGLKPNHLKDMGCAEVFMLLCHYYPACPQPELTIGTTKHADNDFLTVLLQDHIGGLQVLHQNQWIDVPPSPEALVVNIGDLLQLISNDKFKSVEHRYWQTVQNQEYQWQAFLAQVLCQALQDFMDLLKSCYQKRILPSTGKPRWETISPTTSEKDLMGLLRCRISGYEIGNVDERNICNYR